MQAFSPLAVIISDARFQRRVHVRGWKVGLSSDPHHSQHADFRPPTIVLVVVSTYNRGNDHRAKSQPLRESRKGSHNSFGEPQTEKI